MEGEGKRELVEADNFDGIELFVDRALDHAGNEGAADASRAVNIYVYDFYVSGESLGIAVELQVDVGLGVSSEIDAADKGHILGAGKRDRRVDLSVTEMHGGAHGPVFTE